MIDNRELFERLHREGRIQVERSDLFDTVPERPTPGVAAGPGRGDAPRPRDRRCARAQHRGDDARRPGSCTRRGARLPAEPVRGGTVGRVPSDDTQLAFWTLEHLLEHDGLVPDRLLDLFAEREIYGIGQTMLRALLARRRGVPWEEAGEPSAGNGALMRIAPVLIPHIARPSPSLWADVALASFITHDDPASTASCLAFVEMLWRLLQMDEPPPPEWWADTFCKTMAPLEGDKTAYRSRSDRVDYEGPVWRFTELAVRDAQAKGIETARACDTWYSGAYLLETLPSVLLILARHGHDPEEAIVRAVNDTKDNDTVAAIVGAAVGALHGRAALPERWIEGLLGRTTADDDGRVFELTRAALDRWVSEPGEPPPRE
jgi:ADP-ribosyl-[dinitrogen reductase] hydrolase